MMNNGAWLEERRLYEGIPTSTISDALGRHNALSARVIRRSGGDLFGRAYCVRVVVGDSASLHLALEHVPPGSVLVIDAGGFPDRAVWGEVLTAAAQRRGVVGAVIDGAVRDLAAIRARGFPVFSTAVTPAGPHKGAGGAWGGSISCAGVPVDTGDLVVGDDDGVVVVPWHKRADVAARARAIVEREEALLARIADGASSAVELGLLSGTDRQGRGA